MKNSYAAPAILLTMKYSKGEDRQRGINKSQASDEQRREGPYSFSTYPGGDKSKKSTPGKSKQPPERAETGKRNSGDPKLKTGNENQPQPKEQTTTPVSQPAKVQARKNLTP